MENVAEGSCHCGKIQFELKDNPKMTVNCHCNDCRRRNGSAFSTYLGVAEKDLFITEGESYLKKYMVEDSGEKYFCSECGSPIYNKNYRIPGLYMVSHGALVQTRKYTPSFNVFCSTKLEWVDEIKNMKSFHESIER